MKLKDIKTLIEAEIIKLQHVQKYEDPNYDSGEARNYNEELILNSLRKYFGYDYEADEETAEYCLKATQLEIWWYYLYTVLPNIVAPRVASQFSYNLYLALGKSWDNMLKKHALNKDPDICVTHDFIDSNQVMIDTLEDGLGMPFCVTDEFLMAVINMAWSIAKANNFNYESTDKPV